MPPKETWTALLNYMATFTAVLNLKASKLLNWQEYHKSLSMLFFSILFSRTCNRWNLNLFDNLLNKYVWKSKTAHCLSQQCFKWLGATWLWFHLMYFISCSAAYCFIDLIVQTIYYPMKMTFWKKISCFFYLNLINLNVYIFFISKVLFVQKIDFWVSLPTR